MATLMVHVEDALMERISDLARESGKNSEQVVIEALEEAFNSPAMEPIPSLHDDMLKVLNPFWSAQDQEDVSNTQPTPGSYGDKYEEYLAKHWADDIRKGSMNR